MKTSGASRKNPSQRPPGSAHSAVIQPPPLRSASAFPSAEASRGSACWRCSASSTSPKISSDRCSGPEELAILLLPADPDRVALAALERRVSVPGHLRQHPLVPDREMELHQVAEE